MKTAVVCDDDETVVLLVRHLLAKQGFEVFSAGDGAAGLDAVRAHSPRLLVLDCEMPRRTGLELLGDLQSAVPRPYIIFLSGDETAATQERARGLGADEVMVKPFSPAAFHSLLRALSAAGKI